MPDTSKEFLFKIYYEEKVKVKAFANMLVSLDEVYNNYSPYNTSNTELEINAIISGSIILEVTGDPVVITHVLSAFEQAKKFFDAYWDLVKGNLYWDLSLWTAGYVFKTLFQRGIFKTKGPAQRLTASSIHKAIDAYAAGAGNKLYIETEDLTIRMEKNNTYNENVSNIHEEFDEYVSFEDDESEQQEYDEEEYYEEDPEEKQYPLYLNELSSLSKDQLVRLIVAILNQEQYK